MGEAARNHNVIVAEDARIRKAGERKGYLHGQKELFVEKPLGYSYFPKEMVPVPREWVGTSGRLVWFRRHEGGGHYPALERGGVLLEDLEDFTKEVWG